MFFSKYIVIIFLVCATVSIAVGGQCELLPDPSGRIIFDQDLNSNKEKCWTVNVPTGSVTTVDVERFSVSSDMNCDTTNIRIISRRTGINRSNLSAEKETVLCPNLNNWKRFKTEDNFKIILKKPQKSWLYESRIRLTLNYKSESILCTRSDSFICQSGACVAGHKVCDGNKDCHDGSDEFGCRTGVFAAEGVAVSHAESVQWLKDNWSLTSGWQEKTPRAIIALNLATDGNFTESDFEQELVVKQLEVQALAALSRNASNEVSINQLSMFVNALLVTCQNPRNFHGFDLVTLLKEKALVSPLASLPMAYLALCNAKASLTDDHATRKLNSILTSETDYPFMLDIQAVSVMALSCMHDQQTKGGNKSEELLTAISRMKQLQRTDGSLGNIYTTATITQALLSSGEELNTDWSVKSAVKHLMQHLNSTDADISSTSLILPILNRKSMTNIRETNCTGDVRSIAESASIKERLGSKMRVKYSLYLGDEKDVVHTISLRVPENVTAFDVMNVAKEEDVKYDFKWKEMKSSKYVYDIAGKTNDFEENQFWFLYLGKGENDIVHLTKSPDHSVLQNGDHMIMWYKKAEISPGLTKWELKATTLSAIET